MRYQRLTWAAIGLGLLLMGGLWVLSNLPGLRSTAAVGETGSDAGDGGGPGGVPADGPASDVQRSESTSRVKLRFVQLDGTAADEGHLTAVQLRWLDRPAAAISGKEAASKSGLEMPDSTRGFLVTGDSVFPLVVHPGNARKGVVAVPLIPVGSARFRVTRNGRPVAGRRIAVRPDPGLLRQLVEMVKGAGVHSLPPLANQAKEQLVLQLFSDENWEELAALLSVALEQMISGNARGRAGEFHVASVFGLSGAARETDEDGQVCFRWLPAADGYQWRSDDGPPLLESGAGEGVQATWLDFKEDGSFVARADRPAIPLGLGAYFTVTQGSEEFFPLTVADTGSISAGWAEVLESRNTQRASIRLDRLLKGPQGQDATAVKMASFELSPGERMVVEDLLPGEYRIRGRAIGQTGVRLLHWSGELQSGEDLDLGPLGNGNGWSAEIALSLRSQNAEQLHPENVFAGKVPRLRVYMAAHADRVLTAPRLEVDVRIGDTVTVHGLTEVPWRVTANDINGMRPRGCALQEGVRLAPLGLQRSDVGSSEPRAELFVGVETGLAPLSLSFATVPRDAKGDYFISLVRLDRASGSRSIRHALLDVDGSVRPNDAQAIIPCAPGEYRVLVRKRSQGARAPAYWGLARVSHGQDGSAVEMELEHGDAVDGRALNSDGTPASERTLHFFLDGDWETPPDDPAFVVRTGPEGGFALAGVPNVARLHFSDGVVDLRDGGSGLEMQVVLDSDVQ